MTKRLEAVDSIRGLALISMIFYHGVWDLVFLFGWEIPWFSRLPGVLWQQSICWTFLLLAGFCWRMGRHPLRRGLITLGAGLLVSLVTTALGQPVRYGVLTLLGSCTLLMMPLHRVCRRISGWAGLTGSLLLFVAAGIPDRVQVSRVLAALPQNPFLSRVLAFLGFPLPGFVSMDYFPLLPWVFLFLCGYFLYGILEKKQVLQKLLSRGRVPAAAFLGKHSLTVYLLHQPVIYILCSLIASP